MFTITRRTNRGSILEYYTIITNSRYKAMLMTAKRYDLLQSNKLSKTLEAVLELNNIYIDRVVKQ